MAEPYDPNNPLKGATTCRHCGGVAAIVKHGEYRYVCNLCGAPRIQVTNDRVKLSGDEHPDLVRAEETIVSRRFWRGGGLLGAMAGSFGLLCTAVMQLVFSPESLLWSAAGVAMSLPFVLLAFVAWCAHATRVYPVGILQRDLRFLRGPVLARLRRRERTNSDSTAPSGRPAGRWSGPGCTSPTI